MIKEVCSWIGGLLGMATSKRRDSQMILKISLPIEAQDKGDWIVISCPTLDVATQGRNRAEAMKNMEEALYLFLVSCFERGVLDQVLKESGFTKIESSTSVKAGEDTREDKESFVEIPLSILAEKGYRPAKCHV